MSQIQTCSVMHNLTVGQDSFVLGFETEEACDSFVSTKGASLSTEILAFVNRSMMFTRDIPPMESWRFTTLKSHHRVLMKIDWKNGSALLKVIQRLCPQAEIGQNSQSLVPDEGDHLGE